MFDNIADLQKSTLLGPQNNEQDKKTFLAQFDWSCSALNQDQISEIQQLLVITMIFLPNIDLMLDIIRN